MLHFIQGYLEMLWRPTRDDEVCMGSTYYVGTIMERTRLSSPRSRYLGYLDSLSITQRSNPSVLFQARVALSQATCRGNCSQLKATLASLTDASTTTLSLTIPATLSKYLREGPRRHETLYVQKSLIRMQ
ncbi:hypothetical protein KC365_g117 [Hortaea werneckii]|nr:hypothetical protein KC365_g117 [Hortaea werneckii]